ncbi:hypothetical protein KEM52_001207 [Ascosphaera acerosa]|nr:hypothetical protein KEM52_001207 [Ascosphaera acerosa]
MDLEDGLMYHQGLQQLDLHRHAETQFSASRLPVQSKYAAQKCSLGRFQSVLYSQTAMFYKDEVPTTYLNKGQTYMLKVADKTPPLAGPTPTKYVTSIRISFDDDELRAKADDCWRLWKKTRGRTTGDDQTADQKRWLAIELVAAGADFLYGPAAPDHMPTCTELVSSQFDGLSVSWSAVPGYAPGMPQECLIPIRFNFLSTDFMPSKGVKGAPMRLCVKTRVAEQASSTEQSWPSMIMPMDESMPNASLSDDKPSDATWYCKLQAFRDHGAERKFQNHRQQIETAISNNNAKLAGLLAGLKDGGALRVNPSPSSDPGAARNATGVAKLTRRRKGTGSPDLISRVQMKIDALRFALSSAEHYTMLTMTSWHQDDDPEAIRPDILNDGDQPSNGSAEQDTTATALASPAQSGADARAGATPARQPSKGCEKQPLTLHPQTLSDRALGMPAYFESSDPSTAASPYSDAQHSPLYPIDSYGRANSPHGTLNSFPTDYGEMPPEFHGYLETPRSAPGSLDEYSAAGLQECVRVSEFVPVAADTAVS